MILIYICLPFPSPTPQSQLTRTSSYYWFRCHYPLITYLTWNQYKIMLRSISTYILRYIKTGRITIDPTLQLQLFWIFLNLEGRSSDKAGKYDRSGRYIWKISSDPRVLLAPDVFQFGPFFHLSLFTSSLICVRTFIQDNRYERKQSRCKFSVGTSS